MIQRQQYNHNRPCLSTGRTAGRQLADDAKTAGGRCNDIVQRHAAGRQQVRPDGRQRLHVRQRPVRDPHVHAELLRQRGLPESIDTGHRVLLSTCCVPGQAYDREHIQPRGWRRQSDSALAPPTHKVLAPEPMQATMDIVSKDVMGERTLQKMSVSK